jgi:hypothetical protein
LVSIEEEFPGMGESILRPSNPVPVKETGSNRSSISKSQGGNMAKHEGIIKNLDNLIQTLIGLKVVPI